MDMAEFYPCLLALGSLSPGALAAPSAPPPPTLKIHHMNVGKGDAVLIVSPTGKTFLIDGGVDGMGNGVIVPLLTKLGIQQLDYLVASQYDRDHIGGLDEVVHAGFAPVVALDRGEYYLLPDHVEYAEYVDAVAPVRQTIAVDQVIDLGGGATIKCVVVNGQYTGGGVYDVTPHVSEFENAACTGYLLTYGDFTYLTLGDLLFNIEDLLAPNVGDVDALKASHHGGPSGTHAAFVAWTQPEVTFFCVGGRSTFPAQASYDNVSPPSGATFVYQTEATTSGCVGALVTDGAILLETDGTTYTVSGPNVATRTFLCDEATGTAANPGDVALGELLINPAAVADDRGEFLEVTNLTADRISMSGWTFRDLGSDYVRFRAKALLEPRETIAIGSLGYSRQNGGFTPAAVLPPGAFALDDTGGDEILFETAAPATLDAFNYTWSALAGYSLERRNLYQPLSWSNLLATPARFGLGDRGTPGFPNVIDATPFDPILTGVTPAIGTVAGGELVTLSGYDFSLDVAPTVTFDGELATDVTVLDNHTIRARTPPTMRAPPALVDVAVTNANGVSTLLQIFTYQ